MQFHGWRKGESTLVDGYRSAIFRIVTGDCGKDARAVLRASCHRADLIHGRSERHHSVTADAAIRRPQAADAAKCRWADDGAPCFRADRKRCQARGYDCPRARRGTTSPASGVPRILGLALQGSGGEAVAHPAGKFDHGGLADHYGPYSA